MPFAHPALLGPVAARLVAVLALLVVALAAQAEPAQASTADHSRFEALQGPFASGPDVTRACLKCHTEASHQVMDSMHWTWSRENPATGQMVGKRHTMNSFCGSPISNEPRCTSCHVGYGWTDLSQDMTDPATVDCLACHDTTGAYKKVPTDAGHPRYEAVVVNGKRQEPPDLALIARKVGESSRATCGACHFNGGGGDAVKHGDLDSSLIAPPRHVDVHMSPDGANMGCADCHTFKDHKQDGSRFDMTAKDDHGIVTAHDMSHKRDTGLATCESCHGAAPHGKDKLNHHADTVACQTCHIPEFARGGVATKTLWDWSTAGRMDADGKPVTIKDDHGHTIYTAAKGDFAYGENVRPTYAWFNGKVTGTLLTDTIDPSGVWPINRIGGTPGAADSRIWPFKVMQGSQPYDPVNKTLVVNNVFGNPDAFWNRYDYSIAIEAGMKAAGLPYSGKYDFVKTTMHWPITHMVAPKQQALGCTDCHTREEDGRLAGIEGVYMPGRDRAVWLDMLGIGAIMAIGAGAAGHALLRLIATLRRRNGK